MIKFMAKTKLKLFVIYLKNNVHQKRNHGMAIDIKFTSLMLFTTSNKQMLLSQMMYESIINIT